MNLHHLVQGGVVGLGLGSGSVLLRLWLAPAPSCFVTGDVVAFDSHGALLDAGVQVVLQDATRGHTRVLLEGVRLERCTEVAPVVLQPAVRGR